MKPSAMALCSGPFRFFHLRHRTVTVAINMQFCEFLDEVDLRHCEFEQVVDFSKCTFRKAFTSGGSLGTRTTYRKGLICSGSKFGGTVSLNGNRVDGSADFSEARFLNEEEMVDFGSAYVEQSFNFKDAVVEGSAYFAEMTCNGTGSFAETTFGKHALFTGASFENNLTCDNTTFTGVAGFNGLRCGARAQFSSASFEWTGGEYGCVFTQASIGMDLICTNAVFKGKAAFLMLKCNGSGFFDQAKFRNGARFGLASFGGYFYGMDSLFYGQADFSSLKCRRLVCPSACFRGEVMFNELECTETGRFAGARFTSEQAVDFSHVHFGGSLEFNRANFGGPVTLEAARISGALNLEEASFTKVVHLYYTRIGTLALQATFPFAQEGCVNLRGCSFDTFHGETSRAYQLVDAQCPGWFSRDPYLQLEKYYRSVGDEDVARNVYRKGHEDYRKYNKCRWSLPTNITDWLWKALTGYGVEIWRLLAIAGLSLIIGTVLFHLQGALSPASDTSGLITWHKGWLYPFAFSLDLFLPLVNLHIDENWVPEGILLQSYAILHAMVGWLVIPLLLAALAGIMKR